jgi:hypothetical protein
MSLSLFIVRTLYVSRKSITFLGLSYKRENQKSIYLFFQKFDPFSALLNKIGHNLAAYFCGHSTFYSAHVELCGRTIGQFATLVILKVKEPIFFCKCRFNGSPKLALLASSDFMVR